MALWAPLRIPAAVKNTTDDPIITCVHGIAERAAATYETVSQSNERQSNTITNDAPYLLLGSGFFVVNNAMICGVESKRAILSGRQPLVLISLSFSGYER